MAKQETTWQVAGREVRVTSLDRVVFPEAGITKGDVLRYYRAVADGAVRHVYDRPMLMKRFVKGIGAKPFFQKRVPESRPEWIETATLHYSSGRSAEEVVVKDAAALLWVVNLGCLDLNPHPVRSGDLEHPDELRIDLDPIRGVPFSQVLEVAMVAKQVLDEHGLVGWPKTSGSRGFHINVRVAPRWSFTEVRHAALAIARETELRAPGLATSRWWKEERHGVFVDYNQNAFDRTVASAYSVRPRPDARVSAPLSWDEVPDCDPAAFTLRTMPARYAELGDLAAGIDDGAPGDLTSLLAVYAEQERSGVWSKKQPPRPVIVVAQSTDDAAALAGLERWRQRHPQIVHHLEDRDILVDSMRGRSSTWTRIRVNLEHVPESLHPSPEDPDPDDPPRWGPPG